MSAFASGFATRFATAVMVACCVIGVATAAAAGPGSDDQPWLGVGIAGGTRGVRIIEVIRDTPADEAGIQTGDEIVSIASVAVATPGELTSVVMRHRVADRVDVVVWREREQVSLSAVLGPRFSPDEIIHRRLVGKLSPEFAVDVVYGADGGGSQELRGRVLVLHFFSLGCNECVEQHTGLSRLSDEHASDGLVVMAVSADPQRAQIIAWAARSAPSFNVAADQFGTMFRAFQVANELPALVVIDRTGMVRYAGSGGAENLARAIDSADTLLRQGRRVR